MLKLYTNPRSRGVIVEWYLKELGIPYESVILDFKKLETRSDEFLKINPAGKVPTIVDGNFTLFESGAILLYLSEKYSTEDMSTLDKRATAAQWVFFANTTLPEAMFRKENRERDMPVAFGALQAQLSKANHPYILGEQFTCADVAIGSVLSYSKEIMPELDYSPYPAVTQYLSRLHARPASKEMFGPDSAYSKAAADGH